MDVCKLFAYRRRRIPPRLGSGVLLVSELTEVSK